MHLYYHLLGYWPFEGLRLRHVLRCRRRQNGYGADERIRDRRKADQGHHGVGQASGGIHGVPRVGGDGQVGCIELPCLLH